MKVPAAFLLISVFKNKIRAHSIYSYRRIFELPVPIFAPCTTLCSWVPFSAHPATHFAHPAPESAHFCYHLERLPAEFKTRPQSMPNRFPYCSTTLVAWIKLKELYKPKRMLSSLLFSIIKYRFRLATNLYIFLGDNAKLSISPQFQTFLTSLFLSYIVTTSVIMNCVMLMGFDKNSLDLVAKVVSSHRSSSMIS